MRDLVKTAPVAAVVPVAPESVAAPAPAEVPARPDAVEPAPSPTPVVERPVVVPPLEDVILEEKGREGLETPLPAACPACGNVNMPGGLFCITCGAPLQGAEVLPEAPPSSPPPKPEPVPLLAAPAITPVPEPEPVQVPPVEPVSVQPVTLVEPVSPALPKRGLTGAGLGPWLPALIGSLGGLLLIAGSFTPMMRFATSPVTTFNSDAGMGVLFIGLGIGALLLVALKWFRELQVLGAVTLFLIGFIFWRITSTFAGLGSTTAGSGLSLQWGWAVLAIGGVLLLSARLVALRRS